MDTLQGSWLIQRLRRPAKSSFMADVDNAFSFGGGLQSGGLGAKAMELLRPIWSFDYMGAAEFEFGAVPEALARMVKWRDDLVTFTMNVPMPKPVKWGSTKNQKIAEGTLIPVYGICQRDHQDELQKRIDGWSQGSGPQCKEPTCMEWSLRSIDIPDETNNVAVGWLDVTNAALFFIDKTMFEKSCGLFGLAVPC